MNLIVLGGALWGVGSERKRRCAVKAKPVETVAAPVLQAAAAASENAEQPGFMTREIRADRDTGETTEISVIGFVD